MSDELESRAHLESILQTQALAIEALINSKEDSNKALNDSLASPSSKKSKLSESTPPMHARGRSEPALNNAASSPFVATPLRSSSLTNDVTVTESLTSPLPTDPESQQLLLMQYRRMIANASRERDILARQLQSALSGQEDGKPSSSSTPVDRKLFSTELKRLQGIIANMTSERSEIAAESKRLASALERSLEERDQLRRECRVATDKWHDYRDQLQSAARQLQERDLQLQVYEERLDAVRVSQAEMTLLTETQQRLEHSAEEYRKRLEALSAFEATFVKAWETELGDRQAWIMNNSIVSQTATPKAAASARAESKAVSPPMTIVTESITPQRASSPVREPVAPVTAPSPAPLLQIPAEIATPSNRTKRTPKSVKSEELVQPAPPATAVAQSPPSTPSKSLARSSSTPVIASPHSIKHVASLPTHVEESAAVSDSTSHVKRRPMVPALRLPKADESSDTLSTSMSTADLRQRVDKQLVKLQVQSAAVAEQQRRVHAMQQLSVMAIQAHVLNPQTGVSSAAHPSTQSRLDSAVAPSSIPNRLLQHHSALRHSSSAAPLTSPLHDNLAQQSPAPEAPSNSLQSRFSRVIRQSQSPAPALHSSASQSNRSSSPLQSDQSMVQHNFEQYANFALAQQDYFHTEPAMESMSESVSVEETAEQRRQRRREKEERRERRAARRQLRDLQQQQLQQPPVIAEADPHTSAWRPEHSALLERDEVWQREAAVALDKADPFRPGTVQVPDDDNVEDSVLDVLQHASAYMQQSQPRQWVHDEPDLPPQRMSASASVAVLRPSMQQRKLNSAASTDSLMRHEALDTVSSTLPGPRSAANGAAVPASRKWNTPRADSHGFFHASDVLRVNSGLAVADRRGQSVLSMVLVGGSTAPDIEQEAGSEVRGNAPSQHMYSRPALPVSSRPQPRLAHSTSKRKLTEVPSKPSPFVRAGDWKPVPKPAATLYK